MQWTRTRIAPKAIPLRDGTDRYYIDAVREDGFLYRAGVDVPRGTFSTAQIEQKLSANLDYFLGKKMKTAKPGPDAHKGEEGWVEHGAGN